MSPSRLFIRTLILGFFTLLTLSVSLFATMDEVTLEQSLTDKAQRVLDGVYGKGNFIVLVKVDMTDPRYDVRYTRQSQAQVNNTKSSGGDKFQILPGYPVIKNLAPDTMKQLPFDSVTSYSRAAIRQISVGIIVNKGFPKGSIARAQTSLEQYLGLKPGRDRISFTYENFSVSEVPSGTQKFSDSPVRQKSSGGSSSGSTLGLLLQALLIVVLLGFMAVYALFQIQNQKLMVKTSKDSKKGETSGGSSLGLSPGFDLPKSEKSDTQALHLASSNPVKRYFDFVTDENIDKLLFILKKEKIGIENLAVLVPCLMPHLAAKVMSELDLKTQAMISVHIMDTKMVNKAMIEKFEAQLKSAMESMIGGLSVFRNIFESVSPDMKKQLLSVLSKNNPDGYRKVRAQIVVFDDIRFLEDEEMKLLLSEVHLDLISTALVGVDPETYQKVDQNLNASSRDLVEQFQSLKSANLSKKEIELAQEAILRVVERMEVSGKVRLRGKIQA